MSEGQRLGIILANGVEFHSPEGRVKEYCDIEVYRDIGFKGGYDDRYSVTDVVTKEDIEAANNLYAGITALDRRRILGKSAISTRLASVKDAELGKTSPREWEDEKAPIELLLAEFLSISDISLAKAMKILHLKRPHLLPILDSYVVKFLTGNEMNNRFATDELLRIGMDCLEIARNDIIRNSTAFAELQRRLADLPTPLTVVRMYDILCWTQEKWVNRGITSAPRGTAAKSLNQVGGAKVGTPPANLPIGETEKPQHQGEIISVKEFRQIIARADGVIVIIGSTPPKVHTTSCSLLTDDRFSENVVMDEGRSAKYYWRSSLVEARKEFGAVACKKCRPAEAVRTPPDW